MLVISYMLFSIVSYFSYENYTFQTFLYIAIVTPCLIINYPITISVLEYSPNKFIKENVMKNVMVPIARGFEEIELVSVVDILRRAGVRVILASLDSHKRVLGAHNIVIEADNALPEFDGEDFDAIVLAGGYNGMQNLANNELVTLWLKQFEASQKLIAAICASPIVLDKAGVLKGDFTCYPGCESQINMEQKNKKSNAVVKNGNIITSTGPATAIVFALELVKELCAQTKAKELYDELQMSILKDFLNTAEL